MRAKFVAAIAAVLLLPSEITLADQSPQPKRTYELAGLNGSVEILYDTWGVPHIYADSIRDAFFGQGFAAARDRLWQIDSDYRWTLGRAAQLRGQQLVAHDEAARLFFFRGDPTAEWKRYDPRVHEIAIAFTEGVNAFVKLVRDRPELLPIEFKLADYLPDFWDPDDFIRIRNVDASAAMNAARRAELACAGALDLDGLAHLLEPSWTTKAPEGLNACSVKVDDLERLKLAEQSPPANQPPSIGADADDVARTETPTLDADARAGSNAWVVSPRLTATGRPILANDPHLRIGVPSVRWISHLSAPGLDVIGAGYPGNPGIQNGHNARVAFGRTDFSINDAEVYVLETNPDDSNKYLYQGEWLPFDIVSETIEVAKAASSQVQLKYSRFGPIVSEDPSAHRAIAVRLTAMEPGKATRLQYLASNFAGNWADFTEAIQSEVFGTNYLYADVDGHIGWHPAGLAPIRPDHDGLLPVPAERRYEWAGMLPQNLFPSEFNPERGYIASSNQMPFPPGYPYADHKIGFDWVSPTRYNRVVQMLTAGSRFSLTDMIAMQHDVWLRRPTRLIHLLDGLSFDDANLRLGVILLRSWDQKVEANSAGAALYEAWWSLLSEKAHGVIVPPHLKTLIPFVRTDIALDLLEHPDRRLGPDPQSARDDLITSTLKEAVNELNQKLGPDPTNWSWGALHTVNLTHPFTRTVHGAGAQLNVEGGGSGGETNTVMARWGFYPRANVSGGASFSMVLDVGAWDNSLALNLPGQSGDPSSPHYRDLYEPWLRGEPFPLLFSRNRIELVAEERLLLQPAP